MANSLPETSVWEDDIYQLEPTDRVIAGPGGIANRQATQLANRTQYLKDSLKSIAPATVSANGLMSSIDKTKLDGLFSYINVFPSLAD
jgi:hypothetical protein